MSDTFSEEVMAHGSDRGEARTPRAPIAEEVVENETHVRLGGGGQEEEFTDGGVTERKLPESVKARLAAMAKATEETTDETTETTEDVGDGAKPAEAPAQASPTAATGGAQPQGSPPGSTDAKPVVAPAPPEVAEYKTKAERLELVNRQLVDENTELKKPKEIPPPHKLFSEATEGYIDDSIAGLRRYLAVSLGIEDPADKRIDAELRDLYTDLTSIELGVTPDPVHLAKRDAARARHLVAREKRERKAEEQTTAQKAQHSAEAQKATEAATFIGSRLHVKRDDGKSIADSHPLLTQFAESLDGLKPEALLWQVVQREIRTGRLSVTADDDANIEAAAKMIETHYQDLADKLGKARQPLPTQPSTAKPNGTQPSAATQSASKETRQSPGARTLTNADASVAPATPPAKPEPKKDQPPKFKSKEQRKQHALRHLDKRD